MSPSKQCPVLTVLNLVAAACAQRPAPGGSGGPGGAETRGGSGAKAASFAEFATRFTGDSLALSPPSATLAGLHRHRDPETGREIDLDRELDDLSAEGTAKKVRYYRGALEALDREFPAESLPEQERIDRGIIAAQCRTGDQLLIQRQTSQKTGIAGHNLGRHHHIA